MMWLTAGLDCLVRRLLGMLAGMGEKSEADGKEETKTFEEFQCKSKRLDLK